jgi:hypothetical protein
MPTPPILQVEAALAVVHKILWKAAVAADVASMDTLYDDLSGVLLEVERLQFALAMRGSRLRTRLGNRTYLEGQLSIYDSSPAPTESHSPS